MSRFIAVNSVQTDQTPASLPPQQSPLDAESAVDTSLFISTMASNSRTEEPQNEFGASGSHMEANCSNTKPTETIAAEHKSKKRKRDAEFEHQQPRKASKIAMSLKIRDGIAVSASVKHNAPPVSPVVSTPANNEPGTEKTTTTSLPPLRGALRTSPPHADGREQIVDRLCTVAGALLTNKRVVMPSTEKGKKKSDLWGLLQQACGDLDQNKVLAKEIDGITESFLQREQDLKQREQQIAKTEARLREESLITEWFYEQREGILLEAAQKGIELAGSVRFELHLLRERLRLDRLDPAAEGLQEHPSLGAA